MKNNQKQNEKMTKEAYHKPNVTKIGKVAEHINSNPPLGNNYDGTTQDYTS